MRATHKNDRDDGDDEDGSAGECDGDDDGDIDVEGENYIVGDYTNDDGNNGDKFDEVCDTYDDSGGDGDNSGDMVVIKVLS